MFDSSHFAIQNARANELTFHKFKTFKYFLKEKNLQKKIQPQKEDWN